ncbi:RNA polymerase sigma factor [Synoicihabitans lomoniglobus]|uniref:Sigma-70 family RNA polymerase sigma factor n=1 Tax=Synoicihabitans lomoniglobus TaxID=2909285 RepID=A0AAE9ZR29_9BACT|nr:sigma-70 family RNA polymerase sigma factor [Opitutaceae bacterium LMO-M01]WED63645.1 sigma-70 family RNA polymerase sigma factor [Opitutaceae bacterium LMO-M01]
MSETAADTADMLALQAGDSTALDRLMRRWEVRLRSFLLRHLVSQTDALDLAQETFVRIYRHRDRFDDRRRFSTWMFQIALNLVRDQARRQARRPTTTLDDAPELSSEVTPHHGAEASETATAVRTAIAELPAPLREVIVLFEYEHLSHAEIAEIIGATPKAVETRLYRARSQLRTSLARWLEP